MPISSRSTIDEVTLSKSVWIVFASFFGALLISAIAIFYDGKFFNWLILFSMIISAIAFGCCSFVFYLAVTKKYKISVDKIGMHKICIFEEGSIQWAEIELAENTGHHIRFWKRRPRAVKWWIGNSDFTIPLTAAWIKADDVMAIIHRYRPDIKVKE